MLIPPWARDHILAELNGGHPGGARMKYLARCFVWWPGMDQSIEEAVSKCTKCQQSQPALPVVRCVHSNGQRTLVTHSH